MDTGKILQWITGILIAALIGYLGWLGSSVNGISVRLTAIEVSIAEGRAERASQIADLRERVSRLEQRIIERR